MPGELGIEDVIHHKNGALIEFGCQNLAPQRSRFFESQG
jgi:hypothetical protein